MRATWPPQRPWPYIDIDIVGASTQWFKLDAEPLSGLLPRRQAAVLDTLLSHAAFLKQTGHEPGRRSHWQLQHRLALGKRLDARLGIEGDDPVRDKPRRSGRGRMGPPR